MKSSRFNIAFRLLWLVCLAFQINVLKAQDVLDTTTTQPVTRKASSTSSDATSNTYYNRALNHYKDFWSRLIPNQTKIQYAGSIGIVSASAGWHYGRQQRTWETDVFFGIVPKFQTRCARTTLTLKQSYVPFRIPLWEDVSVEPLSCGMFFSTIFGEEFWGKQPSKYPKHYYGFSTKLRANVFVGQRLRYVIPPQWIRRASSISLYYELSTCDLYIASYATNNYLSLWDILSLSFGLKFEIF